MLNWWPLIKNAKIIAEQKQGYYENYFTANTGISGVTVFSYNKITYEDIYPNIDWVLYTCEGELKHEFVVRKGGKVSDIQLKYSGATDLQINSSGLLVAVTPMGTITENAPLSFQSNGKSIKSSFRLTRDIVTYDVGNYSGDLLIDPTLSWGTYFGGSVNDRGYALTVDNKGKVYLAGYTTSSGIATSGAFLATFPGGSSSFLAKFDSLGTRLWSTYFYNRSYARALTTDDSLYIYMAGAAADTGDHGTHGTHQVNKTGALGVDDAYVAKFDSSGARVWSTFLGGASLDYATGVAVDSFRGVYISGVTRSSTNIVTPGACQVSNLDSVKEDAFLVKFTKAGGARLWGTYYGGAELESYPVTAADHLGNVYLAGATQSPTNISYGSSHQATFSGGTNPDAFVVKFDSTGIRQWATYYGGGAYDFFSSVCTDQLGNVYLGGAAGSNFGIATAGAYQTTYGGGYTDGMIVKFSTMGIRLWGSYYGSTAADYIRAIMLKVPGKMYIAGTSGGGSGLTTPGSYMATSAGMYDAIVVEFDTPMTRIWGSYFGGSQNDDVSTAALSKNGELYICGETASTSGIATPGCFQPVYSGGGIGPGGMGDAFLARFGIPTLNIRGGIDINPVGISFYPNPVTGDLNVVSAEKIRTIVISNLHGQLVYSRLVDTKNVQLDLANLPSGMYFVKINDVDVRKFVKQ